MQVKRDMLMPTARGKFRKCQVKEFTYAVIRPDQDKPKRFRATLVCPNKRGNGIASMGAYELVDAAVAELKNRAAPIACGSCALYNMTEAEVLTEQAKITEARALLAEAQRKELLANHELDVARKAVEAGAEEVNTLNRATLGDAASTVEVNPAALLVQPEPPTAG